MSNIQNSSGGAGNFVLKTGDSMSGDLTFTEDSIGPVLTASGGIEVGFSIGPPPFLWMTYAEEHMSRWRITVDASGNLGTTQI